MPDYQKKAKLQEISMKYKPLVDAACPLCASGEQVTITGTIPGEPLYFWHGPVPCGASELHRKAGEEKVKVISGE
jgi:hypothetical protein